MKAAARTKPAAADTATRILDVAERLIQTHGFNGFSYADVAAELGVTKAALHYHFAAKDALGLALIERYTTQHRSALGSIMSATTTESERLRRYTALYAAVLRGGRMCLCGMLAAEYTTLPRPMQTAIRGFFDLSVGWIAELLEHGRTTGEFTFTGTATSAAQSLVGALEGALLVARPYGDLSRFTTAAERLLETLSAGPPRDARPGRRRAVKRPG